MHSYQVGAEVLAACHKHTNTEVELLPSLAVSSRPSRLQTRAVFTKPDLIISLSNKLFIQNPHFTPTHSSPSSAIHTINTHMHSLLLHILSANESLMFVPKF